MIKYTKYVITAFYLLISYWVIYLIFQTHFIHDKMQYSVDSRYENTLMILLVCTGLSMIAIFLLGILTMFTHFVFIRVIFTDEIKQAMFLYVKQRRNKNKNKTND